MHAFNNSHLDKAKRQVSQLVQHIVDAVAVWGFMLLVQVHGCDWWGSAAGIV